MSAPTKNETPMPGRAEGLPENSNTPTNFTGVAGIGVQAESSNHYFVLTLDEGADDSGTGPGMGVKPHIVRTPVIQWYTRTDREGSWPELVPVTLDPRVNSLATSGEMPEDYAIETPSGLVNAGYDCRFASANDWAIAVIKSAQLPRGLDPDEGNMAHWDAGIRLGLVVTVKFGGEA